MDDSRRTAKRDRQDYMREYTRRPLVKAKRRQWERERDRGRIARVEPKVLEEARKDPRYEERHSIRKYVICRVSSCGAKQKTITREHLARRHDGLTTEQYREQFQVESLSCSKTRAKLSANGKSDKREIRGLPRRDMTSVRGHRGEPPLRKWLVAGPRTEGKTIVEIAKVLNRQNVRVWTILSGMGFPGGIPYRYDLGEPVTREYGVRLRRATGLERKLFAKCFGLLDGPALGGSRRLHHRIRPNHARAIIEARDFFIRSAAERTRRGRRWGPDSARTLRALVPHLPQVFTLLQNVLTRTRKEFFSNRPQATIREWQDWVCDKAAQKGIFRQFLPLASEVSRFIKLDALRTGGPPVQETAAQALASRLGVGPYTLIHASIARPLAPRAVKSWILEARHSRPDAPTSSGGRPTGISQKSLWRIRQIAALKRLGKWSIENFTRVYPDTPGSADANARAHASKHGKRVRSLQKGLTAASAEAILSEPMPR